MFDTLRKTRIQHILDKYGNNITGLSDLLVLGHPPTKLFFLIAGSMSKFLDEDPSVTINKRSIAWRRRINWIIKWAGRIVLPETQVIENRNNLLSQELKMCEDDPGICLPEEAVIYVSNHGFMDDVMTSVLTAKRHAFFITNALPEMCNSVDGILSWMNGVILSNHRVRHTKRSVIPKAVELLRLGTDVVVFPEGTWNKSPNLLVLDLWPGVYRMAVESKAMIVPIVHYIDDATSRNRSTVIHTVLDEPFRIDHLSEKEALMLIRDKLASWQYLMMQKYGYAKREEILWDNNTDEVWSKHLTDLIGTNDRYDKDLETSADYRPHYKILPEEVWRSVANIKEITAENASHWAYAKKIIAEHQRNDYQRRF